MKNTDFGGLPMLNNEKNMEKYLKILKNIEVWKNTEMYCTFEDQALQGYETCGL